MELDANSGGHRHPANIQEKFNVGRSLRLYSHGTLLNSSFSCWPRDLEAFVHSYFTLFPSFYVLLDVITWLFYFINDI